MLNRTNILFSIILLFLFISCSPKHSEIVLAEFGDEEIKMGEFEEAYIKNVGGADRAKTDSLAKLKNFLDLYVNFRMKLRDAAVRGFDKETELLNELTDYKKKVGITYILEKQIIEPGVEQLYDRRKWELRVSHIMIRPDTAGEEGAKIKAKAILDSIKNGISFEELAERNSQDFFSAQQGGDMFYITAGLFPVEFENACYKTAVGQVYPEIVGIREGQHIIKVTEKRQRIPKIKASHILVDFNNENDEMDTVAARAKIDSIKMMLDAGRDFAELAMLYSEDLGSKEKGGDLGFFERRMMVKEFDEAVFNLKVGEISDIVKSNFGYHIIKCTEIAPYPTIDEEREYLKKIFRLTRYQGEYDKLIDSLRIKYGYKLNDETYSIFAEKADSVRVGEETTKLDDIKDLPLYTFADKKINVEEFWKELVAASDFANRIINADLVYRAVKQISGEDLLEQEALNLEKTNSNFASLMNDYKNGIFIFKLQEDEVWNKIEIDSVKLYDYYLSTKDKYVWTDRVSFSEIFTRNDSLANVYLSQLISGANFDTLAAKYTERPGFKEKAGKFDLVDAKSNQLALEADKLKKPGEFSSIINNAGGYSIVRLDSKEASRTKTFEEAKAEVSGAFQEFESKRLEKAYLDRLRKRYKPEIDYDKLEQAFKN